MQASASMLRLLSTILWFSQRRSRTRTSRQLLRLINSMQRFGSFLSWSRQVMIPRWLPAQKYLTSVDSSGWVFCSDIAESWWRDADENRADVCELRDICQNRIALCTRRERTRRAHSCHRSATSASSAVDTDHVIPNGIPRSPPPFVHSDSSFTIREAINMIPQNVEETWRFSLHFSHFRLSRKITFRRSVGDNREITQNGVRNRRFLLLPFGWLSFSHRKLTSDVTNRNLMHELNSAETFKSVRCNTRTEARTRPLRSRHLTKLHSCI